MCTCAPNFSPTWEFRKSPSAHGGLDGWSDGTLISCASRHIGVRFSRRLILGFPSDEIIDESNIQPNKIDAFETPTHLKFMSNRENPTRRIFGIVIPTHGNVSNFGVAVLQRKARTKWRYLGIRSACAITRTNAYNNEPGPSGNNKCVPQICFDPRWGRARAWRSQ